MDKLHILDHIQSRISELQKSHLLLQEQLNHSKIQLEQHMNDSALRIIDIIDLIHTTTIHMHSNNMSDSNTQTIIKKIERRLIDILKRWQVQEIQLAEGCIQAGKTRVLDTRHTSEIKPAGTILEVCRQGYQRGDTIIRPADVITASNTGT